LQKIRYLRDWLSQADELGELRRMGGVHWDLEIGKITEMNTRKDNV